nr:protein SABRE isoform X1 [Ipomoea batatas]
MSRKASQSTLMKSDTVNGSKSDTDNGFFLSSDYFLIKKQSPRADQERLLSWQESFGRDLEMTDFRSEFETGSESEDHARPELTEDDGCNVLIADNCQRVFVYGLKLLWNLENRDAILSFVGGLTKGCEPSKPSPSRQYTQMKLLEEKSKAIEKPDMPQDDQQKSPPSQAVNSSPPQNSEISESQLQKSPSNSVKVESPNETAKPSNSEEAEEEGTPHFMVNFIEPQFNLHSEDANGRLLLAAVSGRVLARSFQSVLNVGNEVIEQSLGGRNAQMPESLPQMTWSRMELSVMLEHVQAHVAPTDVDLGAGVQWLPKIRKSSPKVKRTGALLERVFMPCDMFFRYTRHKSGSPDLKVKPLKELSFNSENITATMTSRQFQVMTDVLTNLLLARPPKRKVSLSYPVEDEDAEEEADQVVPYGVEEVELARINLEQKERVVNTILDDIRKLSLCNDVSGEAYSEKEFEAWMVTGGRSVLVQKLKEELASAKKSRKASSVPLRAALQKAAQIRLMEKEKNKSPSHAMRLYLKINKFAWSMLIDGKSFGEAEINDMIYDYDRDYKDVGVAKFTIKFVVIRNCLPGAKCDTVLSAWNPPSEWGKKVMLLAHAKQGPPKDGHSTIELLQVEIYPLKINVVEAMYKVLWEYLFPEEEQDTHRRQEVWKVSTTAGLKRGKKGSVQDINVAASPKAKDSQGSSKTGSSALSAFSESSSDSLKLRRTSSFDRTWEENVAESVANELVLKAQNSGGGASTTSKTGPAAKSGRSATQVAKPNEEKKPRRLREFRNIKISQVELSVTYEGSRFAVSDLRLLMDPFSCAEFTGTWGRLFSRVKKHIIWGVLKSVTGMQVKKFKLGKDHSHKDHSGTGPSIDMVIDDDGGSAGKSDSWPKRPTDAGDGFVTSVRGLFSSQKRKAKNLVLRKMRSDGENEILQGEWSESEAEFSPIARQLSGSRAKKLIRRHTKKFNPGLQQGDPSFHFQFLVSVFVCIFICAMRINLFISTSAVSSVDGESIPTSPPDNSDSSSESSPYEEEREERENKEEGEIKEERENKEERE